MSQQGIIADHLAALWLALTNDQRICWHFSAAKNPLVQEDGNVFSENGWQYFVDVNAPLAVVDVTHVLSDPPATDTAPNTAALEVAAWKLPVKLGAGGSSQRPDLLAKWTVLGPGNTDAIITQEYDAFTGYHTPYAATERISATNATSQAWITTGTTGEYLTTGVLTAQRPDPPKKNKKPAVRHVSTWQNGDAQEINLSDPKGYYATTAGLNRFATIKGMTARRRPDLALGRVTFINRDNGERVKATIPNPTGGSPSRGARPRHFP